MSGSTVGARRAHLGCGEFGFRLLEARERVEIMARLGFRVVEFGIGNRFPGQLEESPTAAQAAEFRRLHEEYGLEPRHAVINSDFTVANPDEAERVLGRCLRLLPVAAECGATNVCIAPAMTPIEEMDERLWDQLVDSLARCDETAREHGLVIGMETHGQVTEVDGKLLHLHTVMTLADPLSRLLAEVPDRVGILWDVANVKAAEGLAGGESDYLYPVIKDRIVSAHLKDWTWDEATGWRTVGIGEDAIDYSKIVPLLDQVPVSLVEYENPEDVEDGNRRSLERLFSLGAVVA